MNSNESQAVEGVVIPPGFELMPPFGPFHELVGPIYVKPARLDDGSFVFGMPVQAKHRNAGPIMHGGMMGMLLDTAFTWAMKYSQSEPMSGVTTNLSINLIGISKPGDWLEVVVDAVKPGKRVTFLSAFVWVSGKRIAQGMAQFQVMGTVEEAKAAMAKRVG